MYVAKGLYSAISQPFTCLTVYCSHRQLRMYNNIIIYVCMYICTYIYIRTYIHKFYVHTQLHDVWIQFFFTFREILIITTYYAFTILECAHEFELHVYTVCTQLRIAMYVCTMLKIIMLSYVLVLAMYYNKYVAILLANQSTKFSSLRSYPTTYS